jgi:hypothetical protein
MVTDFVNVKWRVEGKVFSKAFMDAFGPLGY